MKKFLVGILAAFAILMAAGNASAFSTGSLVAVLYDVDTNTEIGLDLGDLATMDLTAENVVLKAAGSFTLDYDKVGVFGYLGEITSRENYFALTEDLQATANASQFIKFGSATDNYNAGYNTEGATLSTGAPASYMVQMNANGNSKGSYSMFNSANIALGEGIISEAGLTMYLYQFNGVVLADNTNDLTDFAVATITFLGDGSVVLNQTTVPVPGAIVMLASGLLGIAGLRRKQR